MGYETELAFFRRQLLALKISSCVVDDPLHYIPAQIDLGLRQILFGAEEYAALLVNDMLQAQSNYIYCFLDEFGCKYIFFQLPGREKRGFLFIGPYLLQMPSRQWLQEKGQTLGISRETEMQWEMYYNGLPILEDENWLLIMANTLATAAWGPEQDIRMDYVQYTVPDRYKLTYTRSIARSIHEPELNLQSLEQNYASEKRLMEAVSQGQLQKLAAATKEFKEAARRDLGDSLRDRKNDLIILKTLLRKAAEQGGVHPLHIHRLSSRYAEEIENVRTIAGSVKLQEEMMLSFCQLVKNHSLKSYSYYIGQVITLVQYDLTADLRLKTIARQLNVNAAYLSELFHREYGCTITDYIRSERISHGIRLLETTDLSVQQIAADCGVPDTSYFIRLFKKQTGLTPGQYRENFHR
ncbi:MAG: helix-turn-helix transcriptional regulator [Firmicutes bacterium]|nr:helix-turn-helix transcriptional regulator [Bacillota bacterium]